MSEYCINCFKLTEQLDQLKAENEQLQKEREKAKNYNLEYGQLLIKATNKNNKLKQVLQEVGEVAKSTSSFKSIFEEPFVEVMKHCPYLNDNVFCTENKTSCVGCICARKQAVYYGEKVAYLEQILQKISEISDGRSPVSEQMTTAVPTARSWNSVSTKKFQDSEVEDDQSNT